LLDLRGPTSKRKERRGRKGGMERKEREWEVEGVDTALAYSLRDATGAASGPIWS